MTKPNRTVDQLEAQIADVAQLVTRGMDEAPRPALSSADALFGHCKSIVDRVMQENAANFRAAHDELDETEKFVIERGAHVLAELQGLVRMAAETASLAGVVKDQLSDQRANHADLINAETRQRTAA